MFHLLFIIPSNTTVSKSSRFGSVGPAACSAVPQGFPFYSTASKARCTRNYTPVEHVFKKTKVVFAINEKVQPAWLHPQFRGRHQKMWRLTLWLYIDLKRGKVSPLCRLCVSCMWHYTRRSTLDTIKGFIWLQADPTNRSQHPPSPGS